MIGKSPATNGKRSEGRYLHPHMREPSPSGRGQGEGAYRALWMTGSGGDAALTPTLSRRERGKK
jgi:hypothetical protein